MLAGVGSAESTFGQPSAARHSGIALPALTVAAMASTIGPEWPAPSIRIGYGRASKNRAILRTCERTNSQPERRAGVWK